MAGVEGTAVGGEILLGIQTEAFLLTPEASEKYLPHFLASNPGSGQTCCRSDAENTAALSAS